MRNEDRERFETEDERQRQRQGHTSARKKRCFNEMFPRKRILCIREKKSRKHENQRKLEKDF